MGSKGSKAKSKKKKEKEEKLKQDRLAKKQGHESNNRKGKSKRKKKDDFIPGDPTDLNVLYKSLRRGDALRNEGKPEDAVIFLQTAFQRGLNDLQNIGGSSEYGDVLILMQTIKDCYTQWQQKNIAYNPNYNRLKHMKLDDDELNKEKKKEPIKVKEDTSKVKDKNAKQRPEYEIPEDLANTPPTPEIIQCGSTTALFESERNIVVVNITIETLYFELRRADKARQKGEIEDAIIIVENAHDTCLFNLESLNPNKLYDLSRLLRLLKETQQHWEDGEVDYEPNYYELDNLNLPEWHDEENEIGCIHMDDFGGFKE